MKYAVKTDIGKRFHNEDNYLLSEKSEFPMLFAVADGMGGHAAGSVASSLLVKQLETFDQKVEPERELESLRHAVEAANLGIFHAAEKDRSLRGMGTTLVAALILGKDYIAANVGDSRMYQYSNHLLSTAAISGYGCAGQQTAPVQSTGCNQRINKGDKAAGVTAGRAKPAS